MLSGGCLCGAIRYQADGVPFHSTLCHCSMCRRASGAPVVAWFSVERSAFRFTDGVPTRYRSSARGARSFCQRCGTQLTFEDARFPEEIDVTTCSLDDPAALPAADHVHVGTRVPWLQIRDGLPEHVAGRSG